MSTWMPYFVAAPLLTGFVLSLAVALINLAGDAKQGAARPLDRAF